ncbi:MAG TPA: response regulator [Thermodesulfobacteriota bacterium]|nr:response regulator [Thermodesulfobacteriota bacterium]
MAVKRKILIIGVDRIISMDIQQTLKSLGYNLEIAQGKAEGIEKIRQNTYDLIIINDLPQDDGESFYKGVSALSAYLTEKILFISANITDFIKSTGNPFLSKPFSDEQLIEIVKKSIK